MYGAERVRVENEYRLDRIKRNCKIDIEFGKKRTELYYRKREIMEEIRVEK